MRRPQVPFIFVLAAPAICAGVMIYGFAVGNIGLGVSALCATVVVVALILHLAK